VDAQIWISLENLNPRLLLVEAATVQGVRCTCSIVGGGMHSQSAYALSECSVVIAGI